MSMDAVERGGMREGCGTVRRGNMDGLWRAHGGAEVGKSAGVKGHACGTRAGCCGEVGRGQRQRDGSTWGLVGL